jgi:hypothetical protein
VVQGSPLPSVTENTARVEPIDYHVRMCPSSIQTISEIVLAAVTSLTLIVLIVYTFFTYEIAKNSTRQIENSQMPFVALIMKTDESRFSGNWAIKNQGTGTAINIYYTRHFPDRAPMMQWMTPLAPAEEYHLGSENDQWVDFKMEYESLDGIRYRTTVKRENGDLRTKFSRL